MNPHEKIYRELKEAGHGGWGGKKHQERLDSLDRNLNRLLDYLQITSGKVLEMGSGAGDVSIWFNKRGYQVTGVEISETAVAWSREKTDGSVDFICSSVTEEDLLMNQTFDLIVDGNCLHCLFDEDRHKFYSNVKRLLKADGYFYISSAIANNEGETAVIGPLDRCFVTEDHLKKELSSHSLICIKSWLNVHEKYSHFYGVFKHKA
ncbi:class I SAM-dependent methyltransferase [Acidaminobacter sp. JC074]|uniref:class I SAM-dependent methyltransferase n=1 Tax=Acidaminobacter sp. JC074 TaxID=2530199 RepID=UPI001F10770F|nr:class I SAM-dependent methyltransferase [Acidaminobacter sp. JC074]MCH4888472.1 class I SAM-dependent methyltransferase [Acidaminobacter sp. JC074]